jgi:hypothetical protein
LLWLLRAATQTNNGLLDELENIYVKGAATDSHSHDASSAGHACSNAVVSAESGGHGGDTQIHMKQVGANASSIFQGPVAC